MLLIDINTIYAWLKNVQRLRRKLRFVVCHPSEKAQSFKIIVFSLATDAFIGMMTLCIIKDSNGAKICDSLFPIQFHIKAASADWLQLFLVMLLQVTRAL